MRKNDFWQALYVALGILIIGLFSLSVVLIFYGLHRAAPADTGTIIEDSRGPELKRIYEEALK